MQPETFGPYTLARHLATGGMGELHLAYRESIAGFSKQMVVKRIRPELADDQQFIEMFLNEARVAALLEHPNIVHIYELGVVDGIYYLTMEYVSGTNLSGLMAAYKGPLPLDLALHVVNSVCEGLAFAHDAVGPEGQPLSLVHRDINPQNVLIGHAGTVKITDFGIAKARLAQRSETRAGVLKGKLGYLSPEQCRGQRIDRRSDIFNLGLLLFEITVGRPAIPGHTESELLSAAALGRTQRPSKIDPSYPADLERIYLRATAVRPEDRYQTVKAMQEDLLAFQLEHRLVITSAKLAELMHELFGPNLSEERRASSIASALAQETLPPTIAGPTVASRQALAQVKTDDLALADDGTRGSIAAPIRPVATDALDYGETQIHAAAVRSSAGDGPYAATEISERQRVAALDDSVPLSEAGGGSAVKPRGAAARKKNASSSARAPRSALVALVIALAVAGLVLSAIALYFVLRPDHGPLVSPDSGLSLAHGGTPDAAARPRPSDSAAPPDLSPAPQTDRAVVRYVPPPDGPRPNARQPRGGRGQLQIRVRPWARVEINGQPRGTTPMEPLSLEPGSYEVRLFNPSLNRSKSFHITVSPGETTRLVHRF